MSREFMDELDPPPAPEAEREVCRHLRTKTAFGHLVGHNPWQAGGSSTAVYWCLKTMETIGPDDAIAHPHNCKAGRGCWRERE